MPSHPVKGGESQADSLWALLRPRVPVVQKLEWKAPTRIGPEHVWEGLIRSKRLIKKREPGIELQFPWWEPSFSSPLKNEPEEMA